MKTITINLYEFRELPENIQQKVIRDNYDINVDFDWWDDTYQDAEAVGINITDFDIDQRECNGTLIRSAWGSIKEVLDNHGETTDTYQTALKHKAIIANIKEDDDEAMEEAEQAYLTDMLECYYKILKDEYEYLTTDEAIIETIEANEYTFETNGTMRNA